MSPRPPQRDTRGRLFQPAPATQSNHLCVRRGLGRLRPLHLALICAGESPRFQLKSLGKGAGFGVMPLERLRDRERGTERCQGMAGLCSELAAVFWAPRASVSPSQSGKTSWILQRGYRTLQAAHTSVTVLGSGLTQPQVPWGSGSAQSSPPKNKRVCRGLPLAQFGLTLAQFGLAQHRFLPSSVAPMGWGSLSPAWEQFWERCGQAGLCQRGTRERGRHPQPRQDPSFSPFPNCHFPALQDGAQRPS